MSASKSTSLPDLHHQGDEPHLLREIMRTQQVLMNGFTRVVGIPASRFSLMRLLANASPDDVGIMEIARQLGINAAAVTRHVKEMEAERLVLRHLDPRDGRRSYVKLSAKGFRIFEEIHDRSHELERSLSSVISADEMAIAVKVLVTLRGFLESLR